MNTALVKASKILKGMTSPVSTHLDAVGRAREIYLAQIKRAESEYFDRIKKVTEIITEQETVIAIPETPTVNAVP